MIISPGQHLVLWRDMWEFALARSLTAFPNEITLALEQIIWRYMWFNTAEKTYLYPLQYSRAYSNSFSYIAHCTVRFPTAMDPPSIECLKLNVVTLKNFEDRFQLIELRGKESVQCAYCSLLALVSNWSVIRCLHALGRVSILASRIASLFLRRNQHGCMTRRLFLFELTHWRLFKVWIIPHILDKYLSKLIHEKHWH